VVAFYVFTLSPPGWVTYTALLLCVALTFVPIHWVHPVRVKRWRTLTLAVTAAWSIAAVAIIATGFPPPAWAAILLSASAVYFVWLTIDLSFRPDVQHSV